MELAVIAVVGRVALPFGILRWIFSGDDLAEAVAAHPKKAIAIVAAPVITTFVVFELLQGAFH